MRLSEPTKSILWMLNNYTILSKDIITTCKGTFSVQIKQIDELINNSYTTRNNKTFVISKIYRFYNHKKEYYYFREYGNLKGFTRLTNKEIKEYSKQFDKLKENA